MLKDDHSSGDPQLQKKRQQVGIIYNLILLKYFLRYSVDTIHLYLLYNIMSYKQDFIITVVIYSI